MGWLEELFAVSYRETAKMPCSVLYQQAQERLVSHNSVEHRRRT